MDVIFLLRRNRYRSRQAIISPMRKRIIDTTPGKRQTEIRRFSGNRKQGKCRIPGSAYNAGSGNPVCRCLPVPIQRQRKLFLGRLWSRLDGLVRAFKISHVVEELVVLLLGDDVARAVEYGADLDAELGCLEIS